MIRSPRRSSAPPALALAALTLPALALAAALACGCGGDGSSAAPATAPAPKETLSEYGFFDADMKPAPGVVLYSVAAPLWADHAGKERYLVVPKGKSIVFDEGEKWQFPLGTVVIKSFGYPLDMRDPDGPSRRLETRLLTLGDRGWTADTYVWNDEGTEAYRTIAGKRVDVSFTSEDGQPATEHYLVPNTNQCESCHVRDDTMVTLGLITHQMNRSVDVSGVARNQLEWLSEQGLFSAPLPDVGTLPAFEDPFGDGDIDARARAYLHANCSHCHRPGGGGGPSGLVLLAWEKDLGKRGACKIPAAAGSGAGGRQYDIVPGDPDGSIIPYRMSSTDPEIKMPELPNRIPDDKGIALIREWITGLDPAGCGE